MTPPPIDPISQALFSASVELAMGVPLALPSARAILLRVFWIHTLPEESRVALALADARATATASRADPGVLAAAMADRVRHELLASGALASLDPFDDFPSAPLMVGDDVCSVTCSVRFGPAQLPGDLDSALGRSLDAMFLPGSHFRRHMPSCEAGGGGMEKQANALVSLLRLSLSKGLGP